MGEGILVGCDRNQEWLLPWWWKHYSTHNDYPVAFADFGMSGEGIAWCMERGEYFQPSTPLITPKQGIRPKVRAFWEERFGKNVWSVRASWLKKPFAVLEAPFTSGIWLDLDCQVKGVLDPLFHTLNLGVDLALVKDREQKLNFLLPGEINYSSGVVAFRQGTPILQQWVEITCSMQNELPSDQELLTRAIFIHKPALFELPAIYNWYHPWGKNEEAIIHHYCGGLGKIEILKSLDPRS